VLTRPAAPNGHRDLLKEWLIHSHPTLILPVWGVSGTVWMLPAIAVEDVQRLTEQEHIFSCLVFDAFQILDQKKRGVLNASFFEKPVL
jgi:hypothetical protein